MPGTLLSAIDEAAAVSTIRGKMTFNGSGSQMSFLQSIQVGLPQTRHYERAQDFQPVQWRSGIFKSPIEGSVRVGEMGLDGDGQADRQHHGGIDKAVLAYSAEHYVHWQKELPEIDWVAGGFGENLTINRLDESTVCIGDVWQIGTVELEVSQPRQPCWKLCRRRDRPDLAKRVVQTGRCGWILRVLTGGEIGVGEDLVLERRPCPEWTVRRAHDLLYGRVEDREAADRLAALPQLSVAWREDLLTRRVV